MFHRCRTLLLILALVLAAAWIFSACARETGEDVGELVYRQPAQIEMYI